MSKRGDAGVAKIEGMVIFVANTKEGDEVKIKINRVGMGYAIADVVQQQ
jgi:predicted RNA-binding protein with TRAM domain